MNPDYPHLTEPDETTQPVCHCRRVSAEAVDVVLGSIVNAFNEEADMELTGAGVAHIVTNLRASVAESYADAAEVSSP